MRVDAVQNGSHKLEPQGIHRGVRSVAVQRQHHLRVSRLNSCRRPHLQHAAVFHFTWDHNPAVRTHRNVCVTSPPTAYSGSTSSGNTTYLCVTGLPSNVCAASEPRSAESSSRNTNLDKKTTYTVLPAVAPLMRRSRRFGCPTSADTCDMLTIPNGGFTLPLRPRTLGSGASCSAMMPQRVCGGMPCYQCRSWRLGHNNGAHARSQTRLHTPATRTGRLICHGWRVLPHPSGAVCDTGHIKGIESRG